MGGSPLVAAIGSVVAEAAACAVGFGVVNSAQAGLGIALGAAVTNLGVLVYAAFHKHSQAVVHAAKVAAGPPVVPPPPGIAK